MCVKLFKCMKHYLCIVLYGNFVVKNDHLLLQHTGGDTVVEDEPKFKPFTGSGKRLDGKASKLQASEVPSSARSVPSDSNKRSNQQTSAPGTSGASNSTRQKTGKLVFGSSASNNKEPQKVFPTSVQPCYFGLFMLQCILTFIFGC